MIISMGHPGTWLTHWEFLFLDKISANIWIHRHWIMKGKRYGVLPHFIVDVRLTVYRTNMAIKVFVKYANILYIKVICYIPQRA
jgi:hypothetical protein